MFHILLASSGLFDPYLLWAPPAIIIFFHPFPRRLINVHFLAFEGFFCSIWELTTFSLFRVVETVWFLVVFALPVLAFLFLTFPSGLDNCDLQWFWAQRSLWYFTTFFSVFCACAIHSSSRTVFRFCISFSRRLRFVHILVFWSHFGCSENLPFLSSQLWYYAICDCFALFYGSEIFLPTLFSLVSTTVKSCSCGL